MVTSTRIMGFTGILLLTLALLNIGLADNQSDQNAQIQKPCQSKQKYHETGCFVRKKVFFKIYKATFETLEPESLVNKLLKEESDFKDEESFLNALGNFIVDENSQIPMRLTLQPLMGAKKYSKESRAIQNTLKRIDLEVDDNWQLIEGKEHQQDILLYVGKVIGLSREKPGPFFKYRTKGDIYICTINDNKATVEYIPAKNNTRAKAEKIHFASSKVLRGIISSYLCPKKCHKKLKDVLPPAMLNEMVKIYRQREI